MADETESIVVEPNDQENIELDRAFVAGTMTEWMTAKRQQVMNEFTGTQPQA